MHRCIILDNGGDTIKAGYAGQKEPRVIPNTIARHPKSATVRRTTASTTTTAATATAAAAVSHVTDTSPSQSSSSFYVGDELETLCTNYTSIIFRRPIDKGYLVDCNIERDIWSRVFGPDVLNVDSFDETALMVTEPPFNPPTLRTDLCEMSFELFGFGFTTLVSAAYLSLTAMTHEQRQQQQKPNIFAHTKTALVIDSGFSFSHVVPIVGGNRNLRQIRRVDMGGKAMTNYLKELVSMRREFNMMDETYLMNDAKEKTSLVSLDFMRDLRQAQKDNTFVKRYVLPDYVNTTIGYVKKDNEPIRLDEQFISLDQERFTIPELLFTPSDIGLDQAGVAEAAVESVLSDPFISDEQRQLLFDSIVLVGGNTCIPHYQQRIYQEIRKLTPSEFDVTIHAPQDPITCAWKGGSQLMSTFMQQTQNDVSSLEFMVSKKEYEEYGLRIISQKCWM